MVVVLFTGLPGRHRGLVDEETADLLVQFNLAVRLDDDREREPMQPARLAGR